MKLRLLVDINVVLDVLLDRQPHAVDSAAVCAEVETGAVDGFLAAHAVTTIHNLLGRQSGPAKAKQALRTLLRIFAVAPVDGNVIQQAMQSSNQDFEDSVTAAAAQASGCQWIVTRDPRGFRRSHVQALEPHECLALIRHRR